MLVISMVVDLRLWKKLQILVVGTVEVCVILYKPVC